MNHLLHDLGRSDFRCLIVGGVGDARQDLMRLTTELAMDEYVQFTGWVSDSDWVKYLVSADICVAPDPSNPFTDRSTMMKVMEYMAAGKPVVAFDPARAPVHSTDAGLYVTPNDELGFARALATLMDVPPEERSWESTGVEESRRIWRGSTRSRTCCTPTRRCYVGAKPRQLLWTFSPGTRRGQERKDEMIEQQSLDNIVSTPAHVAELDPTTDPTWAMLLDRFDSSVFHSPAWLRVLSDTYGFQVRAVVLKAEFGGTHSRHTIRSDF